MNVAVIFARMGSSRFPGKALTTIGGKKLIEIVIERANLLKPFALPVLATTTKSEDDILENIAKKLGVETFRGDEKNVAKRTVDLLNYYKATGFARINGDSPFTPIELISSAFKELDAQNLDFVTNLQPRTFPYGVSLEIFNSLFFLKSYENFKYSLEYCEHITSYFYRNLETCRYLNYKCDLKNVNHIGLTVDTYEDKEKLLILLKRDSNLFERKLEDVVKVYESIYK